MIVGVVHDVFGVDALVRDEFLECLITDVAKTIVAVVDWHKNLADAIALPNVDNRNGATEVETFPGSDALAASLTARGAILRRCASARISASTSGSACRAREPAS